MIRLGLLDNKTDYAPGEEIEGAVLWEFDAAPKSVELHLVWGTRGKGTADGTIVETISFENPKPGDTRTFKLRLPDGPYSMDGKLISIIWALELIAQPGKKSAEVEITVGPSRRPVRLPRIPDPPNEWKKR
jgi:hypothetical protein